MRRFSVRRPQIARAVTFAFLFSSAVDAGHAQDAVLAVHGAEAVAEAGDPDRSQSILIMLPDEREETAVVRLFDPDTGGSFDRRQGQRGETRVRFTLRDADAATLAEAEYGPDQAADGRWVEFAEITPAMAPGPYTLEAVGVAGDDANGFDVDVVGPRATLTTHDATVLLPRRGAEVALRLAIPAQPFRLETFDLETVAARLDTLFESVPLQRGDGTDWTGQTIDLDPGLSAEAAEIVLRADDGTSSTVSVRAFAGAVAEAADGGADPDRAADEGAAGDQAAAADGAAGEALALQLPIAVRPRNARPEAAFAIRPLNCRQIEFDAAAASDPEGEALAYAWVFADGHGASGRRVTRIFEGPGDHAVRLMVRDPAPGVGRGDATSQDFVVRDPPVAVIAPTPQVVAPGEPLALDGTGSVAAEGAEIVDYEWLVSDGALIRGPTVEHVFSRPGRFAVRLLVRDGSGHPCDAAATQRGVRVNAAPLADAGADRSAAVGDLVVLDGSASSDADGRIEAWSWSVAPVTEDEANPVATLTGERAEYRPAAPGLYRVTLLVDDGDRVANSTATAGFLLSVNAPPVAEAGPDLDVTVGARVPFDAGDSIDPDGAIRSYHWDFGDGASGEGANPAYAYHAPGSYPVTLTVTDDAGLANSAASDTMTVTVSPPPNAAPVADAGPDRAVAAGAPIRFDASSSRDPDGNILSFLWEFGDGRQASGPTVAHIYLAPGRYAARLTVTDDSGLANATTTDVAEITVTASPNAIPTAEAGPDRLLTIGEIVTFDGSASEDPDGPLLAWRWRFGDGATGRGPRVSYAYPRAGIFEAVLEVEDAVGATAADRATITVVPRPNEAPVAEAGPDRIVAPGERITFDGTGSGDADNVLIGWDWDFGDGINGSGPIVTHSYPTPGRYAVTLSVQDASGRPNDSADDSALVIVNAAPVADAGKDHAIAVGESIVFDGTASSDPDGPIVFYTWTVGEARAEGPMFAPTFNAPGLHAVTLAVDDGRGVANSVDTDTVTVSVNAPPVADAGPNREVERDELVRFDATGSFDPDGNIVSLTWDFGDGGRARGPAPAYTFEREGEFVVTLDVVDDSGLANELARDTATVVVGPPSNVAPVADAGEDRTVMVGERVPFDASGSQDADGSLIFYAWDLGDGTQVVGAAPVHVYWTPGEYEVRLGVRDNSEQPNNEAIDSATVTVVPRPNEPPVAVIGAPTAVGVGERVILDGTGSFDTDGSIIAWRWAVDQGPTAEGPTAVFAFFERGEREVRLTVADDSGNENGTDEAVVSIMVSDREDRTRP